MLASGVEIIPFAERKGIGERGSLLLVPPSFPPSRRSGADANGGARLSQPDSEGGRAEEAILPSTHLRTKEM